MRFQVSIKNAVLLGFLLVEVISLMGGSQQGLAWWGARMALVLGYLGMVAWEVGRRARSGHRQAPRSAPQVGEELSVLYHEIRNCTSTLRGNAYLLKQKMACGQDCLPVERIERAAANIERIARDVMVLSDPGRLEPVAIPDLAGLIRECAEEHFPAHTGSFHLECQEAPSRIDGDPGKLRQAFVNLFKNSLEAEADNIRIRIEPAGSFLRILIEDDGTGCPYSDLKRIFLPLQTTKRAKGGMGIGLALVKTIVQGHGGEIWASPRMGPHKRGLAIHITLPAATCPSGGITAEGRRRDALPA
jgi:two-component system, OmpR family, sensor kinase